MSEERTFEEEFEAYWDPRTTPLSGAHALHQQRVLAAFGDELSVIHAGLYLLAIGIEHQSPHQWHETFANEFGAVACFSRAHSALRAATVLAVSGYYTEVEVLLRSAYEAASLARMLAKEPQVADKWLTKNRWTPDGVVRRWVEDRRGDGEAAPFVEYYKRASDATHPTASAAVRSVHVDDGGWSPRLAPEFDESVVRGLLQMCAGATGFACAALRNAAVVAEALPEGLGVAIEDVLGSIAALSGDSIEPDVSRWASADARRQEILSRVRPTEELDPTLRTDPMSWHNLIRDGHDEA